MFNLGVTVGLEMENKSASAGLIQLLESMEETQVVDLSITGIIDNLISDCSSTELYWMKSDIPIETSFLMYHSSRNSRIILEKMKQRFIESVEKHENPAVIGDSLQVAPMLSELHQAVSFLKERKMAPEMYSLLSKRLKALRSVASDVSMLPSAEEELRSVDKKKLKRRFGRFADTVQAMFIESESPI